MLKIIKCALLVLPLCFSAGETRAVDVDTIKSLVSNYFGSSSQVSNAKSQFYVTGDFNADGIQDVAVLFKPGSGMKPSVQVNISAPWEIGRNDAKGSFHTSLAIIHGHADGLMSAKTSVFALLDHSGVLETPAFRLMVVKRTNVDYQQYQARLPVKTSGDILILPTEAGIDTYVYWNKGSYQLHVPKRLP